MANPNVKLRAFVKAMTAAGCTRRAGKGSHCMWYCPCGAHQISVAEHPTIAPNAVRDTINLMSCIRLEF